MHLISIETWLRELPSPKAGPSPAPETGLGHRCRRSGRGATGHPAGAGGASPREGGHRRLAGTAVTQAEKEGVLEGSGKLVAVFSC